MPVDQPFNVYREHLSSHYLGFALWDPTPNSSINDRVSIGDVGFVREGIFLRMFNVMFPHDHPANKKIGEPDPYDPLDCGLFVNLVNSTLTKGAYPSRHVSTVESNPLAATPNDVFPSFEGLTYECPGVGALLYLPDDAFGQDIIRTKVFENYIRDNVASWFAWSQKNGLGVERMEDLILVTGCTLAKSWAAAAFCDPTAKSKVSLSVQSHDDGRASFTWRSIHGSVIHRNSRRDPTNLQPAPNQCVFIKGFRAKRVFFRTRLMRAAAEPLPDDPDNSDEDEIQVTSVPCAPNYRDPLVAILDYIAEQCPEDTIAIAHDDDLDLIKDVEILTADAVEKFLHENQIPVVIENGAATVRDQEGSPVPDEEKATFVATSELGGDPVPPIIHPALTKYPLKLEVTEPFNHDHQLPIEELTSTAVHPPMKSLRLENKLYPQPISIPLGTPSLGSSSNRPVITDDLTPSLPTIRSENILKRVFTHSSLAGGNRYGFQMPEGHPDANNEELWQIGHQVVNLVVTNLIQDLYPLLRVGPASKLRDYVVCKGLLAEICMSYGLHKRLKLPDRQAGSLRTSRNVQANVFEAYVGGVYRDQGIEVVTKWLTSVFGSHVQAAYQTVRRDYLLPPVTAAVPQPEVSSARYPTPSSSEGGGSIPPSKPAGPVGDPHQLLPPEGEALDARPEMVGRFSRGLRRRRSNPKDGGSEDAGPESARKRARSRIWDNI